ncbi:MAG: GNAT family N-acetyltransferase [Ilumatobacteraceae bacterium]
MLSALRAEDAAEMVVVLSDPSLHEFTGGRPATHDELAARYASWVAGSGSDSELWLNWIVRSRVDCRAIGTLQATVVNPDSDPEAAIAWTIGTPWQRRGFATEATTALVVWLAENGIDSIVAYVHPAHAASAAVARRVGLAPTSEVVDGEVVWRNRRAGGQSV